MFACQFGSPLSALTIQSSELGVHISGPTAEYRFRSASSSWLQSYHLRTHKYELCGHKCRSPEEGRKRLVDFWSVMYALWLLISDSGSDFWSCIQEVAGLSSALWAQSADSESPHPPFRARTPSLWVQEYVAGGPDSEGIQNTNPQFRDLSSRVCVQASRHSSQFWVLHNCLFDPHTKLYILHDVLGAPSSDICWDLSPSLLILGWGLEL